MSIYNKAVEKGNIAELHENLMTFLEENRNDTLLKGQQMQLP